MAEGIVGKAVGGVGDYLKEQRVAAALSLRQLAERSGVSNPHLSMIERGLRNPSAQVLQQVAKALQISATQLYVQAGILSDDDSAARSVENAVTADDRLTDKQKTALLNVYASYLAENAEAEDRPSNP